MTRKLRERDKPITLSVKEFMYLQNKISLAGEMKTEIKKFLDIPPENVRSRHRRKLRRAMEAYLNVDTPLEELEERDA